MKKEIQPYVAMFAIGNFVKTDDENALDSIPVAYYTEPRFAPYAKKIFDKTPEMIAFFSSFTACLIPGTNTAKS